MARTADVIGDRWTLLILREAFYGVRRYDDMRADLDIPRAALTDRLKTMIAHGLLETIEYQEPGQRRRSGYALTAAGRALAPLMIAMTEWGERFLLERPSPVSVRDKRSGAWLRLALVDDQGQATDMRAAELARRPSDAEGR